MATITALDVLDIRFPTSRSLDGSDAMNPDPDYSAAYVIAPDRRRRRARGPRPHVHDRPRHRGRRGGGRGARGRSSSGGRRTSCSPTWARFWRTLVGDSQLRWIGPEKGVIHLATAAVVNAVWDLFAKRAGKPLWKLLVDMTPEELVALIDFRYITDALTPRARRSRRLEPLGPDARRARGRAAARRLSRLHDLGRLARLRRRQDPPALPRGARRGLDALQDEGRRGPRRRPSAGRGSSARRSARTAMLMVDANQRWDVGQAIDWMARARASSTRTGSRSRRAPTTSSATPRSPGPSRRSGSRPASTSTTA